MSKCDLKIEFDREQPYYKMGEIVRGFVFVQVNKACECKGLTFTVNWKTHGKGNRASSKNRPMILFRGRWEANKQYRYPFEFQAPVGPVTYHGNICNLDWILQARADIPWAIDPKATAEMILLPGPTTRYNAGNLFKQPRDPSTYVKKGVGFLFYLGLVVVAVAGGIFVSLGMEAWMVSGPIGLLGLLLILAAVWHLLVRSKVGVPKVVIDSINAMPGKDIHVSVSVSPRTSIRFDKVVFSLFGREETVSGSGTNRTTHTHQLYGLKQEVDVGDGNLQAGGKRTFTGRFPLPAEAAPSFNVSDTGVKWWLEVKVGIAGWPDWKKKYVIGVLPRI